jgi:predicted nucleotidyltransferase
VRLSTDEISTIKVAAQESFGDTVSVRLFGSRVHDDLKGGDIDLLIETADSEPDQQALSRFLDAVERATDEKKVDVLFIRAGRPLRGFARMAFENAVLL